jgi:hypothetical protein
VLICLDSVHVARVLVLKRNLMSVCMMIVYFCYYVTAAVMYVCFFRFLDVVSACFICHLLFTNA